jgi:hypothetical protein
MPCYNSCCLDFIEGGAGAVNFFEDCGAFGFPSVGLWGGVAIGKIGDTPSFTKRTGTQSGIQIAFIRASSLPFLLKRVENWRQFQRPREGWLGISCSRPTIAARHRHAMVSLAAFLHGRDPHRTFDRLDPCRKIAYARVTASAGRSTRIAVPARPNPRCNCVREPTSPAS